MPEFKKPVLDIEEDEALGDLGARRMIVNFGPQHPATHGTLRNILEMEGERVAHAEPELGFQFKLDASSSWYSCCASVWAAKSSAPR